MIGIIMAVIFIIMAAMIISFALGMGTTEIFKYIASKRKYNDLKYTSEEFRHAVNDTIIASMQKDVDLSDFKSLIRRIIRGIKYGEYDESNETYTVVATKAFLDYFKGVLNGES